jgi:RNA polymerase sigma factor (TIGR02999 family)
MSNVTHLLSQIQHGDPQAAKSLLPLVYDELRKLAAAKLKREQLGQTLQATALVHEAYLRLVGNEIGAECETRAVDSRAPASECWDSRGHFFAAAAEAMRRILIDQARRRGSLKGGGGLVRHRLEHVEIATPEPSEDLLALNESLDRFEQVDPQKAKLVKLRYFAGLTLPEAAEVLGIAVSTADRHWSYARAWLHADVRKSEAGPRK